MTPDQIAEARKLAREWMKKHKEKWSTKYRQIANWPIHLEEQTATNETGICFKFTEISPGVFDEVVINPEAIPPDDMEPAK